MRTGAGLLCRSPARDFALRWAAWTLGLFGLLRLGWVETHVLLPLTTLQARLAEHIVGAAALPVEVTLACSGADALALCAGAVLAYPARWPERIAGALGGMGLILALNTLRIGTLSRAADSPDWFNLLHVYIWPGVLVLAIAGFVFSWMSWAGRRSENGSRPDHRIAGPSGTFAHTGVMRRFVWLSVVFLVLFTAAGPWYLDSPTVLSAAVFVASGAAVVLDVSGTDATSSANMLSTAHGSFLVTQECIATPLVPVYLAAVVASSTRWVRMALAIAAALPLFLALGVSRLLVVALPAALVESPVVVVHGFYQVIAAIALVVVTAFWSHPDRTVALHRGLAGAGLAIAFWLIAGSAYTNLMFLPFAGRTPLADPQGATALLPAFQVGLLIALVTASALPDRWRSLLSGVGPLVLSQIALLAALHAAFEYAGITPHVREIRGWAVAAPLLLVIAMVWHDARRH